ncbi:glycosyltransferase [Spirochaeta isovalerica]|uniref:Glycosyltransferase involved in cell wall biosynthesis n=1 Tax=Spirochaeta isovalerica TaxID=150 RepID=A0A841RBC9_9SPIO|nr:glycosyltransferase [Spirochaeta isovalerica]MBB6480320.1 glycosyltransferase involved in cell wall biosynthesis [Spirochaeta isovalerica]
MIISGQFNDSLAPIMDGVAITAQNYAFWLNKKYSPSFAIGPRVPGYRDSQEHILRFASLPIQRKGPYRLGLPRIDRSFNERIETIPFDIVHAHCPFVSGGYALSLSKKRNIPMVATFHSKYRDDFARWLPLDTPLDQLIKLIVQFYDSADAVWVPNEAIIDTLRSYGYKGPVDYVPNGSDIAVQENEDRKELIRSGRQLLRTDDSSPVFLYVGQHRWVKNIRRIIEALKILHDRGMDFQMRFVGNGSDLQEMENLVRKPGLREKVQFIGPVYDRKELKAIYSTADLFLFPSLYDNASLATREAAGLSVPTVFIEGATTANGVVDKVNGFLSSDTSEAYADKITEILADRDLLRKTGEGAYRDLYRSWESVAGIVFDKYNQLIEEYKFMKLKKIS